MNSQEWKEWITECIPCILEGSGIDPESVADYDDLTVESNWKRISKTKVKSLVSNVQINQRVFEHKNGLKVTTQDIEDSGMFSASINLDPKDYKVCLDPYSDDNVSIQPIKQSHYIDESSVVPLQFYAGIAEEVCEATFEPLDEDLEGFIKKLSDLGMTVEKGDSEVDDEDEQGLSDYPTDEQMPDNCDFHEAMAKLMNSQAQPSGYSNGDMLNLIDNISKRVLYSLTNSKVEKSEAFIKLRNEIKEIMEQETENYKE